jgi:hypothetical protein
VGANGSEVTMATDDKTKDGDKATTAAASDRSTQRAAREVVRAAEQQEAEAADANRQPVSRDSAIGTADTGPGFTTKAPPASAVGDKAAKANQAPDREAPDLAKSHELRALRGESLHELRAENGVGTTTVDRMSEYGGQVLGNITAERAWLTRDGDTGPNHAAPRTFGEVNGRDVQANAVDAAERPDVENVRDPNHEQPALQPDKGKRRK